MSKLLHTTEHFLGLVMIIAIFGLAVLSVWSLSPISKEEIKVAGISSDDIPAHDLSNLTPVKFELVPVVTDSDEIQAASVGQREIVVRANLASIREGETILGRLELTNSNLFAFPVKVELVNFDQSASENVVVILAANNGKHQLNRVSDDSQPLTMALPAGEDATAVVLQLVASESINFPTNLEIKFSY